MEKRLTTIHGHTTSVAFDPQTGRFFAQDVSSDFVPDQIETSKPRATINTIGRIERDVDSPPDHPRPV
jgi:hypothetical protein